MTTTILLVRHARHGQIGTVLSGRATGLSLSATGRAEARALATFLAQSAPFALQASPMQRAQETALTIAAQTGLPAETVEALNEVDFGEWTGKNFTDLENDPAWILWNGRRSQSCPPNGETMLAAQDRAMRHLRLAAERQTGGTIVMVTHCDIIRAIVSGVLGMSLDLMLRFNVDTASVTRVCVGPWGAQLLSLNEQPFSETP